MNWFEHRHWWRLKTDLNKVVNKEGQATACLIIEDCACGAVRQVEFAPGVAPVIRITLAPKDVERKVNVQRGHAAEHPY